MIYVKFGPVMRHMGYQSAIGKQYVERLGVDNFIKVTMSGGQEHYFMNQQAFAGLTEMTTLKVSPQIIKDVYRLFKAVPDQPLSLPEQTYYMYTDDEMDEIFRHFTSRRMNKIEVFRLLLEGKNRR